MSHRLRAEEDRRGRLACVPREPRRGKRLLEPNRADEEARLAQEQMGRLALLRSRWEGSPCSGADRGSSFTHGQMGRLPIYARADGEARFAREQMGRSPFTHEQMGCVFYARADGVRLLRMSRWTGSLFTHGQMGSPPLPVPRFFEVGCSSARRNPSRCLWAGRPAGPARLRPPRTAQGKAAVGAKLLAVRSRRHRRLHV